MNTITTTFDMGDDSVGVLANLIRRIPKGHRVRVALTDESEEGTKADLVSWLLACPEKGWFQPMEQDTTDNLSATPFE